MSLKRNSAHAAHAVHEYPQQASCRAHRAANWRPARAVGQDGGQVARAVVPNRGADCNTVILCRMASESSGAQSPLLVYRVSRLGSPQSAPSPGAHADTKATVGGAGPGPGAEEGCAKDASRARSPTGYQHARPSSPRHGVPLERPHAWRGWSRGAVTAMPGKRQALDDRCVPPPASPTRRRLLFRPLSRSGPSWPTAPQ